MRIKFVRTGPYNRFNEVKQRRDSSSGKWKGLYVAEKTIQTPPNLIHESIFPEAKQIVLSYSTFLFISLTK